MKARILLLAAGIATLTSCSSLYKTGQTPDDVYYSPARPVAAADEYVQNDKNSGNNYQSYEEYQDSYRNDRFLRLSIGNPYYLSAYNDYGGFDWRANSYAYYWNTPWNNYWSWNNFYNPYAYSYCMLPGGFAGYGGGYSGGYGKISFNEPVSKPVSFNPSSYRNSNGPKFYSGPNGSYYSNQGIPRYNNSNSGTQYSNSNNNSSSNSGYHNNNSTSTPTRSYTPSSSGSSSSGSSSSGGGGGGGGISRPGRN